MSEMQSIGSDAELEEVLARIEEILDAEEGSPEDRELDGLVNLVEAYESARFPKELPDPVEAVKFMMEQAGYGPEDLVSCIGSSAEVLEVLSGEHSITLAMAVRLHERLGIPLKLLWPHDETTARSKESPAKFQAQ